MNYVKTYVKRNDGKIFAVWSDDRDDDGVGVLACYPVEMERDFDPSYESCTIIKSEDVIMYSHSRSELTTSN